MIGTSFIVDNNGSGKEQRIPKAAVSEKIFEIMFLPVQV